MQGGAPSAVTQYRPASEGPDPAGLTWRVRRCTTNVFLCLLVLIFQALLALAVYIYHGPQYSALAFVGLFVALLPFYGAYRYRLTPEGLEVFGPLLYYVKYDWNAFDGWRLYKEEEVRLVLKRRRGTSVVVLFAPGRVTEVLRYVQRCLPMASLEERRL